MRQLVTFVLLTQLLIDYGWMDNNSLKRRDSMASTAAQGSQGSRDEDMPDLVTAHGYQDLDFLTGVDPDAWTEKQSHELAMSQAFDVGKQIEADRDFDTPAMSFEDKPNDTTGMHQAQQGSNGTNERRPEFSRKPSWDYGDDRDLFSRPGFKGG